MVQKYSIQLSFDVTMRRIKSFAVCNPCSGKVQCVPLGHLASVEGIGSFEHIYVMSVCVCMFAFAGEQDFSRKR